MGYIKEDYVLGNKKIVVGDNLHDLVLENLGKIYVRYGNSYKEFNELIKTLGKATSSKTFVIETDGLRPAAEYGSGVLVYDVKAGILYLAYKGELLELVEGVGTADSKFVRKTGDVMTGPLTINTREAPLKVQSAELVKNLNANLLEGHDADEFAMKARNEKITGSWTFAGENEFLKENTFQDQTNFNATAVFNGNEDSAAIRVGTGPIITDGDLGSSQFASGMTGYGWRLSADTNTLEIDNLVVRGVLNVFELVVNKVSATNGSLWVTDSFEIEKVHNLKYIDVLNFDSLGSLNCDTFYIPYIEDNTVYNIDDSRETIEATSALTNFYKIRLNENDNPIATRSIQKPGTIGKTYSRFDFLFQIVDIKRFVGLFKTSGIPAPEYYTNIFPVPFYYDENDLVRVPYNWNGTASQVPGANPNQIDTYVVAIDSTTGAITESWDIEQNPDVFTRFTFEHTYITPAGESLPLSKMAERQTMLDAAANGIIQFIFLYQANAERISDLMVHSADGGEGSVALTPIDPEFDKQIYTTVNATDIEYDNHTKRYSYKTLSALNNINLYYKYFGEILPVHAIGSDFNTNLYVVEAKNEQYPVFKPGDILRCQKFTGNAVKQYNAIVLALVGSYGFLIELQNSTILSEKTEYSYDIDGNLTGSNSAVDTALYERSLDVVDAVRDSLQEQESTLQSLDEVADSLNSETTDDLDETTKQKIEEKIESGPQKGDALVRVGSIFIGDRQRSMLLTSSEDNSPYQDIIVNVNRPDYGVIYFTPKYKTFDAYFGLDGTVRKATFYFQNETFKHIIQAGRVLHALPTPGTWDQVPLAAQEEFESAEFWETHYGDFYDRIKDYVATKEIPSAQIGNSEENYTGLQKIVDVALTYQPNDHTPIYYDQNGNRIKVTLQENGTNIQYFVSSNTDAPVISTFNGNNINTKEHLDKKTNNFVLLSIGQTT